MSAFGVSWNKWAEKKSLDSVHCLTSRPIFLEFKLWDARGEGKGKDGKGYSFGKHRLWFTNVKYYGRDGDLFWFVFCYLNIIKH